MLFYQYLPTLVMSYYKGLFCQYLSTVQDKHVLSHGFV